MSTVTSKPGPLMSNIAFVAHGTWHVYFNRHGSNGVPWCIAPESGGWELAVASFSIATYSEGVYHSKSIPDEDDGCPSAWISATGQLTVLATGHATIGKADAEVEATKSDQAATMGPMCHRCEKRQARWQRAGIVWAGGWQQVCSECYSDLVLSPSRNVAAPMGPDDWVLIDGPARTTIVAFSRFLRARVAALHPGFSPDIDPEVEIIDGRVRVFDQRGESCRLPSYPRQLRQLATMLLLVADEIERRNEER